MKLNRAQDGALRAAVSAKAPGICMHLYRTHILVFEVLKDSVLRNIWE